MLAKPTVAVAWKEELFTDDHGQCWAPGHVTLEWPGHDGVKGSSVTINVVAVVRPGMTRDQLEAQHIQAVRDVLTAATLAIEEPIYENIILPPMLAPKDAAR